MWPEGCPRSGAYALFQAVESLSGESRPSTIWISASQRFRYWVDGVLMGEGPSRADPNLWGYVTLKLPARGPGTRVHAIEVVHWGDAAGKGQTGPKGFLLFAGLKLAWRACHDESRFPRKETRKIPLSGHRKIGAGETLRASEYPWGWQTHPAVAASWQEPRQWGETPVNPWGNRPLNCTLVPEPLPPMSKVPWKWALHPKMAPIPPRTCQTLLFDAGVLLNAVPTVRWSGGTGGSIRLVWSEAPVRADGTKGHRDETGCHCFFGQEDFLLLHAGEQGEWSPPWIRSFRYLWVEIHTKEDVLEKLGVELERSHFPLESRLHLEVEDPLNRAWAKLRQVSLDTSLACSHETFFDCPAWEQAQFPGDARIQALHHYLLANEDRLARKAIRDLAAFRMPGGLLPSHAPSSFSQVIATYSLQWIGMLDDFRIYRGDPAFLHSHLPCARGILEWFLDLRRADGLPGFIREPLFLDWTEGFHAGCAPQDRNGGSLPLACMIAEACRAMSRLERFAGRSCLAAVWDLEADSLFAAIRAIPGAPDGLLPDTAEGRGRSVHTQVQAVLAGVWSAEEGRARLRSALRCPETHQPGTLYYRAHLARAFRACGDGEGVWSIFPHWFGLLENTGLTTWPESDQKTRSDCHGWGVMPEIEWVHTLAGLSPDPKTTAWGRVLFAPHLGDLQRLSADVPHPGGKLRVELRRDSGGTRVRLTSPADVLVSATKETLPPGTHSFILPPPKERSPHV